ncbi:MAG: glycosyltransferase [Bacteroidetes bacterium]|nr:glycosyltransferase [Bacteroidota bacterium]
MKTLLLLTSDFPFGQSEVFVENEFPFLAAKFEQIFIITTSISGASPRPLPPHVKTIRIPYDASLKNKALVLCSIFSKDVREELHFIQSERKLPLSKTIVSILLGGYAKAFEMNDLIKKLLREYSLDEKQLYLYSYWMKDLAIGMGMFKRQHPKVKFFCRAHGWDLYFERHHPPYLPFRKYILTHANACFSISEAGKNYLDNITGQQFSDKLKLSRLGTFNPNANRSQPNTVKIKLVSCSSVIPLKRIHLIIESLTLIKNIEIEWEHVGDGKLKIQMESLAKEKLESLPNISFRMDGHIDNKDLLNYYAREKIDVFINVSETEGLPVSIMEANSFGIPTIATNVGGVSEIIREGENGFLLSRNCSPADIAFTIEKYALLPENAKQQMRDSAFHIWDQNFNAEINYPAFVESALIL